MKNDKLFNRIFSVTLMVMMGVVIVWITARNYSTAGDLRARILLLAAAGASLCGVASTILSANARIANFIFGIINVVVYGTICIFKSNYGSAAVNLLYFLPMQFVGLAAWSRRGGTAKTQVQARRLSGRSRLLVSGLFLAGLVIVYIILCAVRTENGATLGERLLTTDGDLVTLRWIIVVDAMATVCNLIGQYLLSTAFMEQWFFWIIVNISSVVMWSLTAARDVAAGESASLASIYIVKYSFYLVNALNGLRIWLNLSRPAAPEAGTSTPEAQETPAA